VKGVYLAGAGLGLLFLAALSASPLARANLQPPEGTYAGNAWAGSDVMTYVLPARNFLRFGVFGEGTDPDVRRTVGYPFFLAAAMRAFGEHWVTAVLVLQCLLAGLAYVAAFDLAVLLFPDRPRAPWLAVLLLVLSGAFLVTPPALLSDLPFAALFTVGTWLGIAGMARRRTWWVAAHLVVLAAAAQVRPTLVFYPIVDAALLWAIARRFGVSPERWARVAVGLSFAVLTAAGLAPTARNAVNHGYFRPSDVPDVNLFRQFARLVLLRSGDGDRYPALLAQVNAESGLLSRSRRQRELAMAVIREHPGPAAAQAGVQALAILGSSHWTRAARLFFARSLAWIAVVSGAFYAGVYLLYARWVWGLARRGDRLCAAVALTVPAYFLVPSILHAEGSRMRLPVEALLLVGASGIAAPRSRDSKAL
jgi:hypothetical protein